MMQTRKITVQGVGTFVMPSKGVTGVLHGAVSPGRAVWLPLGIGVLGAGAVAWAIVSLLKNK